MKLVKAAGFSSSTSWEGKRTSQTLSFQDIALLKAVLAAGLYDNVGKIMCTKSVDVTEKLACMVETAQGKAQVHPSSVNRDLQTYGWLLYQEKVSYSFSDPVCCSRTSLVLVVFLKQNYYFCSHLKSRCSLSRKSKTKQNPNISQ